MKRIKIELTGDAPLMMHNGQLANPRNAYAKAMREVSKKRSKTDDDYDLLARTEWEGGLYLDYDDDVCIPSDNLLALGLAGAKKFKLGKQFSAGVMGVDVSYKLLHNGPKDLDALFNHGGGEFADSRNVRVQQSFVVRTRPYFRDWGIEFELLCDDTVIDSADVEHAYREAGRVVGCLEMRPRLGRFTVNKFDAEEVSRG